MKVLPQFLVVRDANCDGVLEALAEAREDETLERGGKGAEDDLAEAVLLRIPRAELLNYRIAVADARARVVDRDDAAFPDAALGRLDLFVGRHVLQEQEVSQHQHVADLLRVPEDGRVGRAAEVEATVERALFGLVEPVQRRVGRFGCRNHVEREEDVVRVEERALEFLRPRLGRVEARADFLHILLGCHAVQLAGVLPVLRRLVDRHLMDGPLDLAAFLRFKKIVLAEPVEHVALTVRRGGEYDALDVAHRVDDDGVHRLPYLALVLEERELVEDQRAGETAQRRGAARKAVDLRPVRKDDHLRLDLRVLLKPVEFLFGLGGHDVRLASPVLALVQGLHRLPFGRGGDDPV